MTVVYVRAINATAYDNVLLKRNHRVSVAPVNRMAWAGAQRLLPSSNRVLSRSPPHISLCIYLLRGHYAKESSIVYYYPGCGWSAQARSALGLRRLHRDCELLKWVCPMPQGPRAPGILTTRAWLLCMVIHLDCASTAELRLPRLYSFVAPLT